MLRSKLFFAIALVILLGGTTIPSIAYSLFMKEWPYMMLFPPVAAIVSWALFFYFTKVADKSAEIEESVGWSGDSSERVDSKKIVLRYDGRCIKCGRMISAGEEAYWEKDKGVWHVDCDKGEGSRVPSRVIRGYTGSKGLWAAVAAIVLLAFILGGLVLSPMLVPRSTVTMTTTVTTTAERITTITTCTSGTTTPLQPSKWLLRKPSDPEVINWTDAGKYVGQTKTVEGTIVRAYRSANAIFLDFHDPYQGYFMAVIFKSDWTNFKFQPEIFYKNKEVRVTGLIKTYQGSPEIIVSSPTQVEVANMGFNYP